MSNWKNNQVLKRYRVENVGNEPSMKIFADQTQLRTFLDISEQLKVMECITGEWGLNVKLNCKRKRITKFCRLNVLLNYTPIWERSFNDVLPKNLVCFSKALWNSQWNFRSFLDQQTDAILLSVLKDFH